MLSAVINRAGRATGDARWGAQVARDHRQRLRGGTFLLEVLKQNGVEGAAARAPFFKSSAASTPVYERGRVLQAVVRKTDVSDDTLREVLRGVDGQMSGYELAQSCSSRTGADPHADSGEPARRLHRRRRRPRQLRAGTGPRGAGQERSVRWSLRPSSFVPGPSPWVLCPTSGVLGQIVLGSVETVIGWRSSAERTDDRGQGTSDEGRRTSD